MTVPLDLHQPSVFRCRENPERVPELTLDWRSSADPCVIYGCSQDGEHGKCVSVLVRDVEQVLRDILGSPQDNDVSPGSKLHISSNCEGCEFDLLEALLDMGYMERLASLTIQTHKLRDFGTVEERWCQIMMRLSVTHRHCFGTCLAQMFQTFFDGTPVYSACARLVIWNWTESKSAAPCQCVLTGVQLPRPT